MIELVLAAAAGWSVLRLLGADRRFPWRLAALERRDTTRDRGAIPTRPARRAPCTVPTQGPWPERPARRDRPDATRTRRRDRTGSGRRGGHRDLDRELPGAIDLLRLALSAGHTPHTAIQAIVPLLEGPVGAAVVDVAEDVRRGAPLVEALGRLTDRLGERAAPLVATLTVALSAGTPLGPPLERLAEQERRRARRSVQRRVRRLPVLLLAPLVGLILPAFVVLTIVPVASTNASNAGHLLIG